MHIAALSALVSMPTRLRSCRCSFACVQQQLSLSPHTAPQANLL